MGIRIKRYAYVTLKVSERESEAVKLAAVNLKRDLVRTLDCRVNSEADVPKIQIIAGTVGISEEIGEKADLERLKDGQGGYRREAFLIQEKDGELLIAGTDRRGTIYGIYDFCEWLGVSPWYFFADVPVRERKEACLETGFCRTDHPSVEYRGIFINDEEELEHWVQRYMGEETIGVKTYEKIFELLLRLKMNYIWPAMHVNSFNLKQENGALADRMGIVVGTSHCDMLMRSNNREWRPWLRKKGYTDVEYDYSMEGRNREILKEYWRESIEQNRDFEVAYTLGMRGIHDSGMEGRAMKGLAGEQLLQAKKELLELILQDQEEMLSQVLGKDNSRQALKTFVPYKEVLELYDHGLQVPEDLTLIWVNDNYGHVRRYPNDQEKKRAGGNGIYYHNSYWAPSGKSYLFICSIPLAHTRNELKKAWKEGIRKIWVTNFGAMKPLEMQMSFYARLAWDVGKENALTDDEESFIAGWIDSCFSGSHGRELAPLLLEFDQLTNARKLEQMDEDAFSQTAYGDEAAVRIHRYERILKKADEVYGSLPRQEKDAFFQLVLMKIHAAYFTNCMYYYADRSNLCVEQGKFPAAVSYVKKCREYDLARQKMLYYYNHVMSNGKWNGILTPEDFPPPRTAMFPACKLPLSPGDFPGDSPEKADSSGGKQRLLVTLWNGRQEIVFYRNHRVWGTGRFTEAGSAKWIELANAGEGELQVKLEGPDWLQIEEKELAVKGEVRVLLQVKPENPEKSEEPGKPEGPGKPEEPEGSGKPEGSEEHTDNKAHIPVQPGQTKAVLRVTCSATREVLQIPVRLEEREISLSVGGDTGMRHIAWEEDGRIVAEAQDAFPEEETVRFVEAEAAGKAGEAEKTDAAEKVAAAEKAGAAEKIVATERADAGERKLSSQAGWKRIPNLARDHGALAEAKEPRARLDYWFFNQSEGSFVLELHRFPSLNSVGEIRVGVSLDEEPMQVLATASNDEHKGTWDENVKNNVDKLYLTLPYLTAGLHRISFHAIDRYFAFSRFVIYIEDRRENSLALKEGDQHLPKDLDVLKYADDFYGEIELPPRPVLYLPQGASRDSLSMEDIYLTPESAGYPVTPAQILEKAKEPFAKRPGMPDAEAERVLIDAGAALAQTPYAYTTGGGWNYCCGISHGGTSLAMYLRGARSAGSVLSTGSDQFASSAYPAGSILPADRAQSLGSDLPAGRVQSEGSVLSTGSSQFADSAYPAGNTKSADGAQAAVPELHYRLGLEGGTYHIWMLLYMWGVEHSHFYLEVDGKRIPEKELMEGKPIWRYSSCQVWKWVPVYTCELGAGEHLLTVGFLSHGLRLDSIYLTDGEELPPADPEREE